MPATDSLLSKLGADDEVVQLAQKLVDAWQGAEDKLADKMGVPDEPRARRDFRAKTRIGAGSAIALLLLRSPALRRLLLLSGLGYAAYRYSNNAETGLAQQLATGSGAPDMERARLTAMVAAASTPNGRVSATDRKKILASTEEDEATLDAILEAKPGVESVVALAPDATAAEALYVAGHTIAGHKKTAKPYFSKLATSLQIQPERARELETGV